MPRLPFALRSDVVLRTDPFEVPVMLDQFRRHSRSTLIYVLFGMLIVVFAFTFNTASRLRTGAEEDGTEAMAEVDGEAISQAELALGLRLTAAPPAPGASGFEKLQAAQRYDKWRLPYSGPAGEALSYTDFPGAVPPLPAEKVLTELIATRLVNHEAAKLGLGVSDGELSRRVEAMARIFGESVRDEQGEFDARKYDTFVRVQVGTSKSALEAFLRQQILRDKVAALVTAGAQLTPAEVDALIAADSKRPKLEVVTIDAEAAGKSITVADEVALAWAASPAHAEAIQKAYDAKGETYNLPEKWNVRGLLIAAPELDSAADDAKKAEVVAQRGQKQTDAEALRKELDKAWNGEVDLPPVAKSPDQPAEGEPAKATALPPAEKLERLGEYFGKLATEKSEHSMTKEAGGRFFGQAKDALARAPFGPEVADAVAKAVPGQLVGPLAAPGGFWLVMVESKTEGKVTPLESVKLALATELVAQEQAESKLDELAEAFRLAAAATETSTLADVAKAWNAKRGNEAMKASEAGPIGRSPLQSMSGGLEELLGLPPQGADADVVPGVGKQPELVTAAWKLTTAKPLADRVFKSEDGKARYVVRLAKEPELDDKAKEAEAKSRVEVTRIAAQARRVEAWHSYVAKLLADAEKAGKIKKTEAFNKLLADDKKRYDEALKRAPAAQAPGGIKLNVGGEDVPVQAAPNPAPEAKPAPPEAKPAP
jgi:parvulin-like peptidyl-prolyl isomerase